MLFEFEEDAIGKAVGIRKDAIQRSRIEGPAIRDTHWKIIDGKVWHTREGAEVLLAGVGLAIPRKKRKGESVQTLEEALAPARVPDGIQRKGARRVLVTAVQGYDKQSITGILDNGEGVRVLVADNRNLLPGMEIEVMKVKETADPDLYSMVGELPRSRGRW